jgi:transposase
VVQFAALLPVRHIHDPLGCHRRRIRDPLGFDKLIQVLVFGCGYLRIADATCSATTLGRRRDEWIRAGVTERLRLAALAAYQRLFGLELKQLVHLLSRLAPATEPSNPTWQQTGLRTELPATC